MRRILPFLILPLCAAAGSPACQNIERVRAGEDWYRAILHSGWMIEAKPAQDGVRFAVTALSDGEAPTTPFTWAEAVLPDGERIPFRWEGEDLVLTLSARQSRGIELRVWEWRSNVFYTFPYPGMAGGN